LTKSRPVIFKWRQSEPEVILMAVGWYLRFSLSYRDVEELLVERGLDTDRVTVWRWVQRYAPELERRLRAHLKPTNKSCRVDETYVRVIAQPLRETLARLDHSAAHRLDGSLNCLRRLPKGPDEGLPHPLAISQNHSCGRFPRQRIAQPPSSSVQTLRAAVQWPSRVIIPFSPFKAP
jgi:hypothetical protein